MNCKQGDLAIVIKSFYGNEGKIVRCLRLLPPRLWRFPDGSHQIHGGVWEIDRPLPTWAGDAQPFCADVALRPLPPPESIDTETTDQPIKERA